MYQCVAENRHGVIYANAELRVFGERERACVLSVGVVLFVIVLLETARVCDCEAIAMPTVASRASHPGRWH